MKNHEKMDILNKKEIELTDYANSVALQHLYNFDVRHDFLQEIMVLISKIREEVRINCLSINGAIKYLDDEVNLLKAQCEKLRLEKINQYVLIEKESLGKKVNLIIKQIGFVSGGTQVFSGIGVCAASFGMSCAAFGAPLITHGMNNIYENGYWLIFRRNKTGYTRLFYHQLANRLGYSEGAADNAYALVDIGVSAYGLGRMVLRQDSYRLFRHINSDYIRGWQEMGAIPLAVEITGDITTLSGMRIIKGK
ncbi:DUF4225 domain-containing protein [Pantoea sp. FN0302]|uniref:DUF4225 domain-containing protein n=1 Tax=Pantoea sp. FN0302 TaxID=3418558 RepID=UPI003CF62B18